MSNEHKFNVCQQLVTGLLAAFVDPENPIELPASRSESGGQALADCLSLLGCKEMRVCFSTKLEAEDVEGAGATPANSAGAEVARGALSAVLRKVMCENVLPILLQLKALMESKHSPFLGLLRQCLCDTLREFKEELKDLLAGDEQLAKEIAFDHSRSHEPDGSSSICAPEAAGASGKPRVQGRRLSLATMMTRSPAAAEAPADAAEAPEDQAPPPPPPPPPREPSPARPSPVRSRRLWCSLHASQPPSEECVPEPSCSAATQLDSQPQASQRGWASPPRTASARREKGPSPLLSLFASLPREVKTEIQVDSGSETEALTPRRWASRPAHGPGLLMALAASRRGEEKTELEAAPSTPLSHKGRSAPGTPLSASSCSSLVEAMLSIRKSRRSSATPLASPASACTPDR